MATNQTKNATEITHASTLSAVTRIIGHDNNGKLITVPTSEFTNATVNPKVLTTDGSGMTSITTAEFLNILEGLGAFSVPYWVGICLFSWDYSSKITDSGYGNILLAGSVIEVFNNAGPDAKTIRLTTGSHNNWASNTEPNAVFYYREATANFKGWTKMATVAPAAPTALTDVNPE